ncbi:hypothetical protein MKZ38_000231 [Zalerion maritima]|uniref:Uncharacterized protein n=1 Tax=Zalerion maritima TaxID=339359 RepID=A0AAD5WMP6_9PEZI|nr:hypothetical protein MKZ38_000231 [Zalerion maritima]
MPPGDFSKNAASSFNNSKMPTHSDQTADMARMNGGRGHHKDGSNDKMTDKSDHDHDFKTSAITDFAVKTYKTGTLSNGAHPSDLDNSFQNMNLGDGKLQVETKKPASHSFKETHPAYAYSDPYFGMAPFPFSSGAKHQLSDVNEGDESNNNFNYQTPPVVGPRTFSGSCVQSKDGPVFFRASRTDGFDKINDELESPTVGRSNSCFLVEQPQSKSYGTVSNICKDSGAVQLPFVRTSSAADNNHKEVFSPMAAVKHRQLPAGQRNLSYQERVVAQRMGISATYGGAILNPANWSKDIRDDQNASVWITGLPRSTNHRTLLTAILGVGPSGKVFACVVNAPEPEKGHQDAAAKLVFFTHDAALKMVRINMFLCNGAPCRVSWNRIKANQTNDIDRELIRWERDWSKEALARFAENLEPIPSGVDRDMYVQDYMLHEGISMEEITYHPYDHLPRPPTQPALSRVIVMIGPSHQCSFEFLEDYFSKRFQYQIDQIKTHWIETHDGKQLTCMEWRFGSYRCQAQSAMKIMRLDLIKTMRAWFGIDPLETGTDPWTEDEADALHDVEKAMGYSPGVEHGTLAEDPAPAARFCPYHGEKLPCVVCASKESKNTRVGRYRASNSQRGQSYGGSSCDGPSRQMPAYPMPQGPNIYPAATQYAMSMLGHTEYPQYPVDGEASQHFPMGGTSSYVGRNIPGEFQSETGPNSFSSWRNNRGFNMPADGPRASYDHTPAHKRKWAAAQKKLSPNWGAKTESNDFSESKWDMNLSSEWKGSKAGLGNLRADLTWQDELEASVEAAEKEKAAKKAAEKNAKLGNDWVPKN